MHIDSRVTPSGVAYSQHAALGSYLLMEPSCEVRVHWVYRLKLMMVLFCSECTPPLNDTPTFILLLLVFAARHCVVEWGGQGLILQPSRLRITTTPS